MSYGKLPANRYESRSYKIPGNCSWENISRFHSFRWACRWIWTSLCISEAIFSTGTCFAIMGVIGVFIRSLDGE